MASFPQLNIFEQIINLPEFTIKNYRFIDGFGLVLILEKKEKKAICPHCGKKSDKLHQNYRYLVRDLPMMEHDVYLRVNRRQFKCSHCQKPFTEHFHSLKKTRTYTERLAEKIITEVLESDVKNVARRNGLSDKEIETILKEKFAELKTDKPRQLKKLGIDEIAWVKGQKNYCAVLVDLETRKPVDILENRTKDCLRECFEKWVTEVLKNIEEVSIDLWSAYKNLVQELMPNAEVVADRFHVIKLVNDELDTEKKLVKRKGEKLKKKAEKEKVLKVIKKSKYCLLKNVAQRNGLSQKEVETILKEKFAELKTDKPKQLKKLGIDERGEKNSGGLQQLDGCTYPLMDRFQDPLNLNSFSLKLFLWATFLTSLSTTSAIIFSANLSV